MPITKQQLITTLQEGRCEVLFIKKNGSIRHMICTLNRTLVPLTKSSKVITATSPLIVPVWDVEKKAWRSFRVKSVLFFDKENSK